MKTYRELIQELADIPDNSIEALDESRTLSPGAIKSIAVVFQGKLLSISKQIRNEEQLKRKIDLLAQQNNLVGGISLLAVAASGGGASLARKLRKFASAR